ncbi:MAG: EamA family transporter, partial [Acidimicrobiales bacterium]
IGWALLTGATIGTYTLIDSAGARRTEGLPYGLTLIACSALAITLVNIGRGRAAAFRASLPGAWRRYALGGACTTAAYSLVLIAVRYAPVGYVATLRESSVLIAALLGWLVLHETLGRRRSIASAVMAAGLALLVATR